MRLRLLLSLLVFSFVSGCFPSEIEEIQDYVITEVPTFESGYFFYGGGSKIPLYRNFSMISAQFKENVSVTEAQNILDLYGLSLYREYHGNTSLSYLLQDDELILKLPFLAVYEDYLFSYPRREYDLTFGSHPSVKFSVPTYALDDDGDWYSHYFICDIIGVRFKEIEQDRIDEIIAEHKLQIVEISKYGRYRLRITENSKRSTLDMANLLHELDETEWSQPSVFVPIITE